MSCRCDIVGTMSTFCKMNALSAVHYLASECTRHGLVTAAESDDGHTLSLLLNGEDLQNDEGRLELSVALRAAAMLGNATIVKMLYDAGACTGRNELIRLDALVTATTRNFVDVVDVLLSVPRPDDWVGRSALHWSAENGNAELVKKLLSSGIEVDIKEKYYHMNRPRCTPLHRAAANGQIDVVKLLLAHGANIDAVDWTNNSPLYRAALNGHADVAELLLDHGAAEWSLQLLLSTAAMNGHANVIRLLIDRQLEKIAGAAQEALHHAAHSGHCDIIQMLLNAGTHVDVVDDIMAQTPLITAACSGQVDAIRVLLTGGADIDFTDHLHMTALQMAAHHDHKDAVKFLLLQGADTTCKVTRRRTAVAFNPSADCAELIRRVIVLSHLMM